MNGSKRPAFEIQKVLQCEAAVDSTCHQNADIFRYKTACESVKSCPITFKHPIEAQKLHGLGPKLCSRLTDKLKVHCAEKGLLMPELPHRGRSVYLVIEGG